MRIQSGRNGRELLPLLAYLALGIIWGSNFIYMKRAADLITPLQIVFFRVLFGWLPVLFFGLYRGTLRFRHFRHSGHFFMMSLLATSVYYYGFAKGTSLLFSGVAGALAGSIPLFSVLLALIFLPEEKLSRIKLAGICAGCVGVILIGRPSGGELGSSNIEGVINMVVGCLSVGASFVYAKKYIIPLKIPASALTTYQLGFGLLSLALITNSSGAGRLWSDVHACLGVIVGLGLLGTGGAYLIYYYLVDKMGAIGASTVTFIPPVVALFIGTVIVGEPITAPDYFAALFIGASMILLNR